MEEKDNRRYITSIKHLSNWIKLLYTIESLFIFIYLIGIVFSVLNLLSKPDFLSIAVSVYLMLLISYAILGQYKQVFRRQIIGFWMKFAAHIGLSILPFSLFLFVLLHEPHEGPEPEIISSGDLFVIGLLSSMLGTLYSSLVMAIYAFLLELKFKGIRTWSTLKRDNGISGIILQLPIALLFAIISFLIVLKDW